MLQSNQGSGSFVPMDTDNDEISKVPSTSCTDTRIARSGSATPTGLPPGTFARGEIRRTASQQRAAEEQTVIQAIVRRLERMDRILSLYNQNLATSQDADHLALSALPPAIRQILIQLAKTRRAIRSGARIVGQGLHNIDSRMILISSGGARAESRIHYHHYSVASRLTNNLHVFALKLYPLE